MRVVVGAGEDRTGSLICCSNGAIMGELASWYGNDTSCYSLIIMDVYIDGLCLKWL